VPSNGILRKGILTIEGTPNGKNNQNISMEQPKPD
jgi:hypothetical protein